MKKETQSKLSLFWDSIRWREVALFLLVLLIIVSCFIPMALRWAYQIEARNVLVDAKNIKLSIELLSVQYYGEGRTMDDRTKSSGLTPEAEADVRSLSGVDGDIQINRWDEDVLSPEQFIYISGRYIAVYDINQDEDEQWQVMQIRQILSYAK